VGADHTPVVAVLLACASCSQIEQGRTGRRALQVAQVLVLTREHGPAGLGEPYPERVVTGPPRPGAARRAARAGVVLGAAAA
jgi:hypothetical protein